MEKTDTQTRKRFKTQQEREEYTRVRKRLNKREQRKRDKAKKEQAKQVNSYNYIKSFSTQYRRGFYWGLKYKKFNVFLSLTCKDTVGLNRLIYNAKGFVNRLKTSNILGNYFLVYEYEGGNYHVHILAYIRDREQLNHQIDYWKLGNKKIVEVVDQPSKETHINYCTKQLNPDNHNYITQRLIDSWELELSTNEREIPIKHFEVITDVNEDYSGNSTKCSISIGVKTPAQLLRANRESKQFSHLYKYYAYRIILWAAIIGVLFTNSNAF